jgi:hypothetical protein
VAAKSNGPARRTLPASQVTKKASEMSADMAL